MRIAFLSRDVYDMLTGGHRGNVGGAQLQQILIARELARRGHEVFFVETTDDYKEETVVDGIRVVLKEHYPTLPLPARLPARLFATFSTLRSIDPEAVYMRIPNVDVLPAVAYCTLADARFVYGFAHDREVADDPESLEHKSRDYRLVRRMLRTVLRGASALVAQNDFQLSGARRRYPDTDVSLISNGFPDPEPDADAASASDAASSADSDDSARDRPEVLWVATLREWKRPRVVLELASRVPDAEFVIVGGEASEAPDLYESVRREAERMDNVRFEGFVPYAEVNEYFESADIFVNTSTEEGFPNTFLQSWAHRTPVVSLDVDPNGILDSNPVGHCAEGSVEEMANQLRRLVRDDDERARYGRRAYEYFRENHSIESVATQYEGVFAGRPPSA